MKFIFKNTQIVRALQFVRSKFKRTERKGYRCVTCLLSEEDEGIDEARIGLWNHFGGNDKGRLNSFPSGFDEETYKKAKPHFESSLKAFTEAGKTLKDLFKFLIANLGIGIKPYAIQFALDMQLGVQLSDKQEGDQDEYTAGNSNDNGSDQESGSDNVSGDDRGEESNGDVAVDSTGNVGSDKLGNGQVDAGKSKSNTTGNGSGTEADNGGSDSDVGSVSADEGNRGRGLTGKNFPN